MQPALKDVGKIASLIGASPLSQSPLWNRPVDSIGPIDLFSFVSRCKMEGKGDLAESCVEVVLTELIRAVGRNEIPVVQALQYKRPDRTIMTLGELREGFAQMTAPTPAAILFGLETGLGSPEVVTLTWEKAIEMENRGVVTVLAKDCLRIQPRHLNSTYVFWRAGEFRPIPLFGLDHEVFDAFGMIWGELCEAYKNLILVDSGLLAASFNCLLRR